MSVAKKCLLALNKLFPLPVHPFNLQNEGKMTYPEWQFEKGADTIKFYTQVLDPSEMFAGKTVLDIGCGAGGKSMYYCTLGAEHVHGVDVVEEYAAESAVLAQSKGLGDKFTFTCCDAAQLPFADNTFDTIIMNDSMEHVAEPERVLEACHRVLKPDGRLFVNFCPYHHPYGAHLSDVIGFPWVHLFFSEKTMIAAYKDLIADVPDRDRRLSFRFSADEQGNEHISYINKMTIRRYKRILQGAPFAVQYYREVPLRGCFKPLAHLPLVKECFVKMVVTILTKR